MELVIDAMLRDLLADADKAYKLPKGVKEDIESLLYVEEMLLPVLCTIAEGPMDQFEEQAEIWARDATGLLSDIEHAVFNFRARISASTGAHPPGGLKALIGKINSKWATAKARRQVATNFKDLTQRTTDLVQRSFTYDTDSATLPGQAAATDVHPQAGELVGSTSTCTSAARPAELVGIDRRRDELVQILTEEGSTSNRQLKMVSILGEAGVGKTTLAKAVYDQLANQFDCAAWVTVSTQRDSIATFEDMLRQISQQVDQHQPVPSHPDLENRIYQVRAALEDKRYHYYVVPIS